MINIKFDNNLLKCSQEISYQTLTLEFYLSDHSISYNSFIKILINFVTVSIMMHQKIIEMQHQCMGHMKN